MCARRDVGRGLRGLAAIALLSLWGCAASPKHNPATANALWIESIEPPLFGFYGKRLRDGELVIAAHASVSDEAMIAGERKLETMLVHAPLLRRNLTRSRMELHVIGKSQFT